MNKNNILRGNKIGFYVLQSISFANDKLSSFDISIIQ